jgi:hypothetical protein
MNQKSSYQAPSIRILQMDLEGVIAASTQDFGAGKRYDLGHHMSRPLTGGWLRQVKNLLPLLLLGLVAGACGSEDEPQGTPDDHEGKVFVQFTATQEALGADTRTVYTAGTSTESESGAEADLLTVKWNATASSEKMGVIGYTDVGNISDAGSVTGSNRVSNTSMTFTGWVSEGDGGTNLYYACYYPYQVTEDGTNPRVTAARTSATAVFDLSAQSCNAANPLADLQNYDVMYTARANRTIYPMPLVHACAALCFKVTLPADAPAIKQLVLRADEAIFFPEVTLTFRQNRNVTATYTGNPSHEFTLTLTNDATSSSARTLTAYAMIPAVSNFGGHRIDVSAYTDGDAEFQCYSKHIDLTAYPTDQLNAAKCYSFILNAPVLTYDYAAAGRVANSYMVHPDASVPTRYRIPIDRINAYWGNSTDAGYGNTGPKLTDAESVWSADLLWSDIDAIDAPNDLALTTSGGYVGNYGSDYIWFDIPANTPAGNFVVTVTDGSSNVLWSYHIWVTDYNPDSYTGGLAAGTSAPCTGGQVETYGTTTIMMDRNLGMIANKPSAGYESDEDGSDIRGLLHYQFGRKDPFPSVIDPRSEATSGPVTIATAVQHPSTLYTSDGNWASEATATTYLWNDPAATAGNKSIYDPCPWGWRVPETGVWGAFGSTGALNVKWEGTSPVGLLYNTTAPYVYYAAFGSRFQGSGTMRGIGQGANYWSASPYSESNGTDFYFDNGFDGALECYPTHNLPRAASASIRCAKFSDLSRDSD